MRFRVPFATLLVALLALAPSAQAEGSPIEIGITSYSNNIDRDQSVYFRGIVENVLRLKQGGGEYDVRVFFEVEVPGVGTYSRNLFTKTLSPGEQVKYHKVRNRAKFFIPSNAPDGTYTVTVYAADARRRYEKRGGPDLRIFDSASFQFTLGEDPNPCVESGCFTLDDLTPSASIAVNSFTTDPQRGGSVFFRGPVTNLNNQDRTVYVYYEVDIPGAGTQRRNLGGKTLGPMESINYRIFRKNFFPVPEFAPSGTYEIRVYVALGNRFGPVLDSDSFTFEIFDECRELDSGYDPCDGLTAAPTSSSLEVSAPEAGPNPFRDATTIRYALTEDAAVDLRVFDVTGREVASLVSGMQSAGTQSATLRAGELPGGTYIWRLSVGGEITTGRVTLAR